MLDLTRPLEGDCELELVAFDSKEGREVFWHSSSHILGQALERLYGALLTHGPPLDRGFFYDSFMGELHLSQAHYEEIEQAAQAIARENQPFERVLLSKEQALQLFACNPFKEDLIRNKVPEGAMTSAYRCGGLVDLCMGPHLPSTGLVKGFKVTKNSTSNWLGQTSLDSLQRIYGVSFPTAGLLEEHLKVQAEL